MKECSHDLNGGNHLYELGATEENLTTGSFRIHKKKVKCILCKEMVLQEYVNVSSLPEGFYEQLTKLWLYELAERKGWLDDEVDNRHEPEFNFEAYLEASQ